MEIRKLLTLLVLLFMIPEASTVRADSSEWKIYKNGRTDPYKHKYYNRVRSLKPGPKSKGRSGNKGGGKKQSSNNETSTFWWPDPNYKYVQGDIENEVTYYNKYYDKDDQRTIMPIYKYYMKADLKFKKGYYSEIYKKEYFDGYGYNYYYGGYGYYQYSINDRDPTIDNWFAILYGVIYMCGFTGSAFLFSEYKRRQKEKLNHELHMQSHTHHQEK